MKTLLTSILLISVCCASTCSSDEPDITSNEYESCCGTQPVERAVGKGLTYIPNVFTPNGDGINDFFRPYVSEGMEAQAFTIYSAEGDTILYSRSYYNNSDMKTNPGWNGLRKDGTAYRGKFKYGVAMYETKVREELVGEACCVRCDPSASVLRSKSGCFYPAQASKSGSVDKSVANGEKGCF